MPTSTEPLDALPVDQVLDDTSPEVAESAVEDIDVVEESERSANEDAAADGSNQQADRGSGRRSAFGRIRWTRLAGFWILPALALALIVGAGYLGWQKYSYDSAQAAAAESVSAATDTAIAMLSYKADTAEQSLSATRERLTGTFRDEYTKLINAVVIPGAKEKNISVTATVPIAASISATAERAVVLVFVNQTTFVGVDPPSDMASSVLVTLEKQGDTWLVSKFEPV